MERLPGTVDNMCGPLTYLVQVGNCKRFCHIDHLQACNSNLLQSLSPLRDFSLKKPIRPTVDLPEEANRPDVEPSKEAGSAPPFRETAKTQSTTNPATSSEVANQPTNVSSPRPVSERKLVRRLIEEM